jgi:hypothetical protein
MSLGIFGQLDWLTTRVKRLCCAVEDIQQSGAGSYKVYTAVCEADGSSITLNNSLGSVTFSKTLAPAGNFKVTSSSLFTVNKTFILVSLGDDNGDKVVNYYQNNSSDIDIITTAGGSTSDFTGKLSIEIRVYN